MLSAFCRQKVYDSFFETNVEPPATDTQATTTTSAKPGPIPVIGKDLSKKPKVPKPTGAPPSATTSSID